MNNEIFYGVILDLLPNSPTWAFEFTQILKAQSKRKRAFSGHCVIYITAEMHENLKASYYPYYYVQEIIQCLKSANILEGVANIDSVVINKKITRYKNRTLIKILRCE